MHNDLLQASSITAELLAGAWASSLVDRHHFDLNLSDLLDKSTQCKRNWLLNVIAARQRCERQQANFEGTQNLSIVNSKLIQQMTTGRASQWSPSTLSFPMPHPLASPSPQSTGTKDTASSAEDPICNQPEWSNSSLALPTATMCARPCNPYTNLQRVHRNCSNKDRSTPAKCSTMEFPTMDCSLVAPAALCSALIPLTTEPSPQAHLALFLTMTNNSIFQCLCPTQ